MTQHIFLLFNARTGSTFLIQLFSVFKDSYVLCKYGEIFTMIDTILKTFNGIQYFGNVPNLRKYVIDNPLKYIEFIDQNINDNYLFSKIQMPYLLNKNNETIKNVLYYNNSKIITITRNPIDSFISEKKAKYFKKWSEINTSNIKIRIDTLEFLEYYKKITQYINKIKALLGNKLLIIKYEDIHKYSNNKAKLKYLQSQLRKIGLNMVIDDEKFNNTKFLFKQDKNILLKDKILNFDEFNKYIRLNGLGFLLK